MRPTARMTRRWVPDALLPQLACDGGQGDPARHPRVLVLPAFLEQGAPHGHRRGPRFRGHADGWDVLAFADPALADTAAIAAGGRLDGGVLHDSPGASSAAVRGRPTNG
jgi:hypothetical protein